MLYGFLSCTVLHLTLVLHQSGVLSAAKVLLCTETSECASFPDKICELSVRNSCSNDASHCQYRHSKVPYQWQVIF